jgi:hypothetical protein
VIVIEEVHRYSGLPMFVAGFRWTAGELMEKFIRELGNKRIFASRCPNCGYTHVPPRIRCVRCYTKMGEDSLVELSGRGKLLSYTAIYFELDGAGNFRDVDEPKLMGAVKLEGADSTIFVPLGEVSFEELKEGMEVEVVWRAETKGEVRDMTYFRPLR